MIKDMRKNFLYTLLLLIGFSLLGVSCSKGGDDDPITPDPPVVNPDNPDPPTSPSYPTFDSPNWSVSNASSFEYTMTMAVALPDSLIAGEQSADKLAMFAGDDCRGIADRIEVSSGKYVWLAVVYGNNNSETISFKYYSSKTKYMYQSSSTKPFAIDGVIGTIDNPEKIGMNIVTKK